MNSTVACPAYCRSSTTSSAGPCAASPVSRAVIAWNDRRRSMSGLPRQDGGGPSSAAASGSRAAAAAACSPSRSRSAAAGIRLTAGATASTTGCRKSDRSAS